MIKVICIKSSICEPNRTDVDYLKKVSSKLKCNVYDLFPISGKEYSVVNIYIGKTLKGTDNNIWYKLVETGDILQHSSLFAISPNFIRDAKLIEILE